MKAKDLMTPAVECISPDMQLRDVARIMKSEDLGFVPVCQNDRLVGTITDRDIVLRAIAQGKDTRDCTVRDVMTPGVFWCYDDQTADDVAKYMSSREIRRMVILNRAKRLAGVISIGDLAKNGEHRQAGEALRNIAAAPPARVA